MKPIFKVGDTISSINFRQGLEKVTVIRITKDKYYCRILNGVAILPINVQSQYKKIIE